MKKEYKEVEIINKQIINYNDRSTVELSLFLDSDFNYNDFKLLHAIEVPETIKEFREVNNISKKDLLKWLGDNYK